MDGKQFLNAKAGGSCSNNCALKGVSARIGKILDPYWSRHEFVSEGTVSLYG